MPASTMAGQQAALCAVGGSRRGGLAPTYFAVNWNVCGSKSSVHVRACVQWCMLRKRNAHASAACMVELGGVLGRRRPHMEHGSTRLVFLRHAQGGWSWCLQAKGRDLLCMFTSLALGGEVQRAGRCSSNLSASVACRPLVSHWSSQWRRPFRIGTGRTKQNKGFAPSTSQLVSVTQLSLL